MHAALVSVPSPQHRAAARPAKLRSEQTQAKQRLGRSGCGDLSCACDVDSEGFEISPCHMMTEQVFITATDREMKDEEMRVCSPYWCKRIFHRGSGRQGYDTTLPRSFKKLHLFSRCLPASRMPAGSQITVGFGEVTIRSRVDVTYPPAATGKGSVRYKSNRRHICIRYDRALEM